MDLAFHYDKTPVQLKDISARQNISLRYLEQIVSPLISAKLIKSTRGPRGGISLAKPPRTIRLLDIIQVMEGPIAPVDCVDNPGICTRAPSCVARDIWTDLTKAMCGVLESTTLQDLVERQYKKEPGKELQYSI